MHPPDRSSIHTGVVRECCSNRDSAQLFARSSTGSAPPLPRLPCCATSPYPPTPPIPYPTPMPTRTRVPLTLSLSKGPHLPRRSPTPRHEGAGFALPCFPLSVCGGPPAMPSAPLRHRGPQIRLVSFCRLFRHPPAGPSAHRPARAWQIRLVSLCRNPATFRRRRRPTYDAAARTYDLSPFSDRFNTPQRGPWPPVRPVPGRYALFPFVDLSISAQTQSAPRFLRHGPPENRAAHHSAQFKPDPRRSPAAARCGCRACPACPCCHAVTPTSPRCGCRACPAAVTPATLRTPFRRE